MTEPRYPCVHVGVGAQEVELASSLLWDAGACGIEERDATTLDPSGAEEVLLVAHFATEEEAEAAIGSLSGRWSARLEHVVGDAWKERWREFFKPVRVGRRVVVRPSWEAFEAGADDVVVTIDPGQAFGTGTHESTRLVLAELDARIAGGERVLDVGCGSGILAIGALLLGAADAVAVDTDPLAVEITRENAGVNGVADRVRASTTPIARVEGRFDLVLANIRAPVLIEMAGPLAAHVAPGGALVLSGLLVSEGDAVREAFDPLLRFARRRVDGEWLALVHTSAPAGQAP